MGLLGDGVNSMRRYVQQNFRDDDRQQSADAPTSQALNQDVPVHTVDVSTVAVPVERGALARHDQPMACLSIKTRFQRLREANVSDGTLTSLHGQ